MFWHAHLSIRFAPAGAAPAAADDTPMPLWSADDAAKSETVAQRNAAMVERLRASIPGIEPTKNLLEDMAELCSDDDISQEAVLRRYHRSRFLTGPWRHGELSIEIFDEVAWARIPAAELDPAKTHVFAQEAGSLVEAIETATGMLACDPVTGLRLSSADAVAQELRHNESNIRRAWKAQRAAQREQRLGAPSFALLTLLALLASLAFLWDGVTRGTLMAGADPNAATTFVADAAPPPTYRYGLFPQFSLDGRIAGTNQAVRLPVFRNEFIRAGPGAPYTVLPTRDSATPYVLRSAYESATPLLRAGGVGVAWHAGLAVLPAAVWYFAAAAPVLRAPPERRRAVLGSSTGRLLKVLLLVAVFVGAVLARRLL